MAPLISMVPSAFLMVQVPPDYGRGIVLVVLVVPVVPVVLAVLVVSVVLV
jgi:hypothetical protein